MAQQTSLVGSIGVLFQYPNVAELLDKIGVKVEAMKSTPLKAAPDGFEPTSPEARAALEFDHPGLLRLVQRHRAGPPPLTDAELATAADGRVFTGHQGIDLKLVDELGDERAALAWLAKEKNVDAKLPVRDYRAAAAGSAICRSCMPRRPRRSMRPGLTALAAAARSDSGAVEAVERFNLDGLLALWHPAGAN